MGYFIKPSDFETGKFQLTFETSTEAQLQAYIDRYEEQYLIELLGVSQYTQFKADVPSAFGPPTSQKFKDIYDPIKQDDGSCVRISKGIKDMLLGFIWFEYVRNQKFEHTKSGIMANKTSNSREVGFEEGDIYGRYNEAIASYETIQWYIVKNKTASVYELYNGQAKTVNFWC